MKGGGGAGGKRGKQKRKDEEWEGGSDGREEEREREEGKDGEKIGRFCNRCIHDTLRMPGQGNKRTLTNTNCAVAR